MSNYINSGVKAVDNAPEEQPVQLSATDPIKEKKKISFTGVAAAAGIAAVAIGGILIYKNSPARIMKEAENIIGETSGIKARAVQIQEESEGILQKGREVWDEVTGYIKEGVSKNYDDVVDENGNIIRKFITSQDDEGKKVLDKMIEYTKEGAEKRATTVVEGLPESVEDFAEKTMYKYCPDGTLETFYKGFERLSNEAYKAAESFRFADGRFREYSEDLMHAEGKNEAAKNFYWNKDGFLGEYIENMEDGADLSKINRYFSFDENENITLFMKDAKTTEKGAGEAASAFEFVDGKPGKYMKDVELDANGDIVGCKKQYEVVDGKFKKVSENIDDYDEFEDEEFEDDFFDDEE
ncbi:MAG: hypothetical protein LUE64_00480 [Candidatus Gastranaerophilales bacterium]|nr:hypothetical protein [Candidatus Gastranaerophilales bacterium]